MDKAEWEAFGKWVESLRKRAGLQVRELAERANVSAQWLQEIRHGGRAVYGEWRVPNPKDEALARLAQALSVPVDELLARAGRSVPPTPEDADEASQPEADAAQRIRELEARVERHEQDLAELRRLLEQRRANAG